MTKVAAKKAIQMVVNTPNVVVYLAEKGVCEPKKL